MRLIKSAAFRIARKYLNTVSLLKQVDQDATCLPNLFWIRFNAVILLK